MAGGLVGAYDDLLSALEPGRQAHSLAVGRKASDVAFRVPAAQRSDLVAAAVLHDVGYGHVDSGFHPLDGARFLARLGFTRAVCHLVVHHSASTLEAEERGIERSVYGEFGLREDLGQSHAVIWWADMTTGPEGQDVSVEERLEEICERYGPGDLVTRFVTRARPVLLAAGQSPIGSIQLPW